MSTHIESKKEDIAKTVIMPGDPKRASLMAKLYLKNVKLVNNVRGMTAYTGYYKDKKVTIFPSGMGIPSMGIYSYELFVDYEVDNIIRIGTCGSYTNLGLNDLILVNNSYTTSSYAKVLNNDDNNIVGSSNEINNLLMEKAKELNIKINYGNIYTTDVFYNNNNYEDLVNKYQVLGVEMESFALLYNAKMLGKQASSLLLVSDTISDKKGLSSKEREENLSKLFLIALDASLKL